MKSTLNASPAAGAAAGESQPRTIEYGGWLPAFEKFGDCGNHPQFAHIDEPPQGVRFRNSGLPWPYRLYTRPRYGSAESFFSRTRPGRYLFQLFETGLALAICLFTLRWGRVLSLAGATLRFVREFKQRGYGLRPILAFVLTRDLRSQLLAPGDSTVFLTSIPFTLGQFDWVVEIEDTTTLFFPFHLNGSVSNEDIAASPYPAMVRYLLELPSCRAVLTHMQGTFDSFEALFGSEIIRKKLYYVPLGIKRTPFPESTPSATTTFLFWNSWHQKDGGFFLRGGIDVIHAFHRARSNGANIKLVIRSAIPDELPAETRALLDEPGIEVISTFLERQDWRALQAECDVLLLPSARIHVVSLLESLTSGRPVITSDGWGIDEYVDAGRTALVVPGRGGNVSWIDPDTGVLNEDYRSMYRVNEAYVVELARAMQTLAGDPALRERLVRAAARSVAERFDIESMNRKFGEVLQAAAS